ncbi:MAG: carotenoid biosynthesis protein [Candidatus Undinarchaeales archaeon]|jgi:putative membrane protein|nr:carotenoid biosynthesis protein [Candidatus Undinarchaeales archaeon]MDP7492733.1 carotenoid biosynthesis protein [Candidatus Undinarchaeales archaeon]
MIAEATLHSLFIYGLIPLVFLLAVLSSLRTYGRNATIRTFLTMAVAGLLMEGLTMRLFASHTYNGIFPVPIGDVPLVIVLGWVVIIFISHEIVQAMQIPRSTVGFLMMGALAVNIDLMLDPLAEAVGLWHWNIANSFYGVPLGNFLGWFLIVFLFNHLSASRAVKRVFPNVIMRSLFLAIMPVLLILPVGVAWLHLDVENVIGPVNAKAVVGLLSCGTFIAGVWYAHARQQCADVDVTLPCILFLLIHLAFLAGAAAAAEHDLMAWSVLYIAAATPYLTPLVQRGQAGPVSSAT